MKTEPDRLLLAIDIGNSNLVAGIFNQQHLIYQWRMESNTSHDIEEYQAQFAAILTSHKTHCTQITSAIISSVVPSLEKTLSQMCQKIFSITPTAVRSNLDTGMKLNYQSLATLGPDRITNGVAALARYGGGGRPIIVVDAGTAITLDVITSDGAFIGGAILPGLNASMKALTSETASLPSVPIEVPVQVIGRNTVECIQSGVCLGTVCMVDGLLARMDEELGGGCTMVATGGNSPLIVKNSRMLTIHDPDLTLMGLQIIHSRVKRHEAASGESGTKCAGAS